MMENLPSPQITYEKGVYRTKSVCVTNPSKLDSYLNGEARSKNAYALQSSKNTNSKEDIPRFNVEI